MSLALIYIIIAPITCPFIITVITTAIAVAITNARGVTFSCKTISFSILLQIKVAEIESNHFFWISFHIHNSSF